MSTKTFDGLMPLAPKSDKNSVWPTLAKHIAEFFANWERAVEASNLVERGIDPLEVYNRVYKAMPLRDL